MFRGVPWAENLTAFSNYIKLHVKKTVRGGAFSGRIFLLKSGKAKHMPVLPFWPVSGGLAGKSSPAMSSMTLTCSALSYMLRYYISRAHLWMTFIQVFKSWVPSLTPAQENVEAITRRLTAHLQVLPKGDFFSFIRIHYHQDGRLSH